MAALDSVRCEQTKVGGGATGWSFGQGLVDQYLIMFFFHHTNYMGY